PGTRSAAADARVGHDAGRGPTVHLPGARADDVPGAGHPPGGAGLQSARGRAPGRARPADARPPLDPRRAAGISPRWVARAKPALGLAREAESAGVGAPRAWPPPA